MKATAVGALVAGGVGSRASTSGPRVVVVGAGAFGGWTALHLLRGGAAVTLVDAWGPGNPRSSSGGESRMIRALYGEDRIYSEMVKSSFEQFEALESLTGVRLYRETGALWLFSTGDDSYARESLPVLEDLGFPVDRLSVEEASRRWPQVSFAGVESVYLERQAGVLSARNSCRVVRDRFVEEGGTFRIARAEAGPFGQGRLTALRTGDGGRLEADHFVFCAGPWLGEILPEVIGDSVTPSRQEVYYFGPPFGSTDFDLGHLPGWIDFGDEVVYGFPRSAGRGLKFADDSRGERFDPTAGDRVPTAARIEQARAYIARRFPAMAGAPLVESRVCQYENSPDGELIIDRHPEIDNLWIAGGGSGHGFKLGPAVGELVARAVLGRGELRPEFRLQRLAGLESSKTQFD